MNLLFLIIILLSFRTMAALPEDIGLCNSSFANSGCILIDENPKHPEDGKVQIYYQWLAKPDPQKQTFFFLNGGPGGSLNQYFQSKDFWQKAIGLRYNILFFDPRGVGGSSPISQENVVRRKMQNYQIDNLVADIEELRQHLVPGQKIGLIGHSFGAHLVFAYATQHPDKLFKLISLHGAATGLGFVSQNYFQGLEWEKAIKNIDPIKLKEIEAKIKNGQACSVPDEKPLPPSAWDQLQLVAYVGSYSQRQIIGPLINQSIKVNIEQNKVCAFTPDSSLITTSSQNLLDLNVFANKAIVCNSLLTDTQIEAAASIYREGATRKRNKQCSDVGSLGMIREKNFNVLNQLSVIKVPMLIVGAENDQMLAPIAQKQIWDALSETQKMNSRISILSKCGHTSYLECPLDLGSTLSSFVEN
ncbi:MAG: alpha/beta hydrolase family protein [Pseudobdellovibrionaceae bacterium]